MLELRKTSLTKKTTDLFSGLPEEITSKFEHDFALLDQFDAQLSALANKRNEIRNEIKARLDAHPGSARLPVITAFTADVDVLEQEITIIQQKHEMSMGISRKVVDKLKEYVESANQVDEALQTKESEGDDLGQMEMFQPPKFEPPEMRDEETIIIPEAPAPVPAEESEDTDDYPEQNTIPKL